jgi:hypothetical protein
MPAQLYILIFSVEKFLPTRWSRHQRYFLLISCEFSLKKKDIQTEITYSGKQHYLQSSYKSMNLLPANNNPYKMPAHPFKEDTVTPASEITQPSQKVFPGKTRFSILSSTE